MINTKRLTILAVMSALSIILVLFINVPIIPSAPYLRYDPGDIPIIIAAFLFGYKESLAVAAVVAIIQGLLISADSGVIGIAMHFLATSSFIIVARIIYNLSFCKGKLVFSLIAGSVAMIITMVLLNLIAIPLFLGFSIEQVYSMLIPIVIPFNVIKALINSVLVWIIYKPVLKVMEKGL